MVLRFFLRRPARAFGAAPAPLVLLRGLRSPLAPSLRSGAAGLLRLLREPAAFGGRDQGHALFPLAASQALPAPLCFAVGLASRPRNPLVSSAAPDIATQCAGQVPGATFGVSLHMLRSPSVLLRYNFFGSRLSINPDVSTEARCPIVDARFIARTLLLRQGWKRYEPMPCRRPAVAG